MSCVFICLLGGGYVNEHHKVGWKVEKRLIQRFVFKFVQFY